MKLQTRNSLNCNVKLRNFFFLEEVVGVGIDLSQCNEMMRHGLAFLFLFACENVDPDNCLNQFKT